MGIIQAANAVDRAIWSLAGGNGSERDYLRAIHSRDGAIRLRRLLNKSTSGDVWTARITSIWLDKHPQVCDPCCAPASTEIADLGIIIRRWNPSTNYRAERMWLLQGKLSKGTATFSGKSSQKQVKLYECVHGAPSRMEVWGGNANKATGGHIGTFDLAARFARDHLPGTQMRDPYFWSYLLFDRIPSPNKSPIWHQWPATGSTLAVHGFAEGLLRMSEHFGRRSKAFGAQLNGPNNDWGLLAIKLLAQAQSRAVSTLPGGPWVRWSSSHPSMRSVLASPREFLLSATAKDGGEVQVGSTGLAFGKHAHRKDWKRFDARSRRWFAHESDGKSGRGAVSFLIIDQTYV